MDIEKLNKIISELNINNEFSSDDIDLIDSICLVLKMLNIDFMLGQNLRGFIITLDK